MPGVRPCPEYGLARSTALPGVRPCPEYGLARSTALPGVRPCPEYGLARSTGLRGPTRPGTGGIPLSPQRADLVTAGSYVTAVPGPASLWMVTYRPRVVTIHDKLIMKRARGFGGWRDPARVLQRADLVTAGSDVTAVLGPASLWAVTPPRGEVTAHDKWIMKRARWCRDWRDAWDLRSGNTRKPGAGGRTNAGYGSGRTRGADGYADATVVRDDFVAGGSAHAAAIR